MDPHESSTADFFQNKKQRWKKKKKKSGQDLFME